MEGGDPNLEALKLQALRLPVIGAEAIEVPDKEKYPLPTRFSGSLRSIMEFGERNEIILTPGAKISGFSTP